MPPVRGIEEDGFFSMLDDDDDDEGRRETPTGEGDMTAGLIVPTLPVCRRGPSPSERGIA